MTLQSLRSADVISLVKFNSKRKCDLITSYIYDRISCCHFLDQALGCAPLPVWTHVNYFSPANSGYFILITAAVKFLCWRCSFQNLVSEVLNFLLRLKFPQYGLVSFRSFVSCWCVWCLVCDCCQLKQNSESLTPYYGNVTHNLTEYSQTGLAFHRIIITVFMLFDVCSIFIAQSIHLSISLDCLFLFRFNFFTLYVLFSSSYIFHYMHSTLILISRVN